jgi:hypothetical protein
MQYDYSLSRVLIAAVVATTLTGCGGDAGGVVGPPPTPPAPTPGELVPESIPYDIIGPQSIFFQRQSGGRGFGLVRLNGDSRTVTVHHKDVFEHAPVVSPAGDLVAFWCRLCPGGFSAAGDAVMVRHLADSARTARRMSGDEVLARTFPAWSPGGQFVYWLEAIPGTYDRIRLVRRSPDASAGAAVTIAELDRGCYLVAGQRLAVSPEGDVAFTASAFDQQLGSCRSILARWMNATGTVQKIADFGAVALAWSPDGARLVVLHELGSGFLTVMDADGSNATLVLTGSRSSGSILLGPTDSVCWGRDGARIFFTYYSGSSVARVWSVRPDGTGAVAVTSPMGEVAADGDIACVQ